ncbi:hypothetical protein KRMM14A1004_35880 [Krasilnikovia sp. MM14-A1004]
MAGQDGDGSRDEAGVDVTFEQLSHPNQPFRREAGSRHLSLPTLRPFASYTLHDARAFREGVAEENPSGWKRLGSGGTLRPPDPRREPGRTWG